MAKKTDRKSLDADTFHHDATLPNGTLVGRRRQNGEVSVAFITPLKEGVPLSEDQELVSVSSGDGTGCPRELRLESLGKAKESTTGKGPAKVTTRAYRSNYDGIFGAKPSQTVC